MIMALGFLATEMVASCQISVYAFESRLSMNVANLIEQAMFERIRLRCDSGISGAVDFVDFHARNAVVDIVLF
jgi:hypothetical protein